MNKIKRFIVIVSLTSALVNCVGAQAMSMFDSFKYNNISLLSAKVVPTLFNFQRTFANVGSDYVSTISQDPGLAALGIVSAHYLYNRLGLRNQPKTFYRSAAYAASLAAGAYCGARVFPHVFGSTKNYIVPAAFLGMHLSQSTHNDSKNPTTSTLLAGAASDLFRYGLISICKSLNTKKQQSVSGSVNRETCSNACQTDPLIKKETSETQTEGDDDNRNYIRLLHSVVTHGLEPLLDQNSQRLVVEVSSSAAANPEERSAKSYKLHTNGSMWCQLFKVKDTFGSGNHLVNVSIQPKDDDEELSESVSFDHDPVQIDEFRGSRGFVAVGYSRAEFDLRNQGFEPFPGECLPCAQLTPQQRNQFDLDPTAQLIGNVGNGLSSAVSALGNFAVTGIESIAPYAAQLGDYLTGNQPGSNR